MTASAAPQRAEMEAFWMPFTANRQFKANPRLLAKASGMHYWTPEGRQILDGVAGLWCVNAGHGRREITEAVSRQIAEMDYAPPFQMGHPAAFELANEVVRWLPEGLDQAPHRDDWERKRSHLRVPETWGQVLCDHGHQLALLLVVVCRENPNALEETLGRENRFR
jgi:hypothetical protein